MKIKIRKEDTIALLLFLPFIEGLIDFIKIYKGNAIFRSIVFLEIIIAVLLASKNLLSSYKGSESKKIISFHSELLFVVYTTFSLLFTNIQYVSLSTLSWVCTPILYSMAVCIYVIKNSLSINLILRKMLIFLSWYCCFAVLRNILKNGLFINSSVRLNTTGGGPVIFGYFLAICIAILYLEKDLFSDKERIILLTIYSVTIIATGSRGALFPALMVIISDLIMNMKTRKGFQISMFLFVSVVLILFIFDPLGKLEQLFPHFFDKEIGSRGLSYLGCLSIFGKTDMLHKIIGYGWGNLFPYQEWVYKTTQISGYSQGNIISIMGERVLVQPHNTLLYVVLESGIIGLVLFMGMFFKYFKESVLCKNLRYIILLIVVVFVNFFDSVFIVEPGTSSVIWLFLSFVYIKNRMVKPKEFQ